MLKIATFNIKNDYKLYDPEKAETIYNFLVKEKIDILCLQEVFDKCSNDLCKKIKDTEYNMYGKYRFHLHVLRRINEKTPIITKKGKTTKTMHLPHLPSPLKRVITKVNIDTSDGKIAVYNTHLDFMYEFTKKRQLKRIIKIIKKEKLPVVLVGDFNAKTNKEFFNEFVDELKELGIERVKINEKTLKQSKYNRAIDHLFISTSFEVISKKVEKDLKISDHYPLIITIKKKKEKEV